MLRISNHYVSKVVFSLLFLEVLILIGSFYAGAGLRVSAGAEFMLPQLDHFFLSACVFAAAIVFSMSALGMYQVRLSEGLRNSFFLQLMPSFAMGFCILTLVFYLAPDLYFGRGILVLVFCISGTGIVLARMLFLKTSELSFLESRILFIGCGTLARDCGELARAGSYHRYRIAGYVRVPCEDVAVPEDSLLVLEEGRTLLQLARQCRVSEIVVSVQNRRGVEFPIADLLDCKLFGIEVTDSTTFFERETCQIRVESVQPSWLVFGGGFDQSRVRTFMKRSFDLVASLLLLVVTLPVMLLTALAIYIEDRAPVFYSQERVGKDGHLFRVLKFRSMYMDAERGGPPQWAARNDPRITRVGRVIRKLRIDELPQILNVLKGEMSFVGPRPERPYFVSQLNERVPYYNVRHSIKPGITGWAQVRYGYGDSVDDALQKLQYDLYYVKNNSLLLDVLVLIDTFKVVMFRGGR
ncbi:sugar transferase (PEP-CTERM system associated)/exopolysaccharide biosynthesis polyprenyl glycosylphosphotransferase [Pseudoduganella lurida]|uniref:Sugar transferase (PEP-CTERM system associated)/exopolysaccharide biosynthesis polyprenyl glycosylphosphotransferase n=1 Tax=Pseudoduganella lurida TaxID=1036180 RepID=A0A562R344_9BURK|nr:TIGR03013 family XrtA/PEP-CTERM system glycosyltransferase [Pseudoduganella lurida]TWI62974.1 sugar transferase (PEP-CTERM system associated)/exopolysaccharide biosynthesis polyprenyl glycosylphosphotransferase [Pseudoduganella lurida]